MSEAKTQARRVLYLLRAYNHLFYHETTIRNLLSIGHQVELLFDQRWCEGQSETAVRAFAAECPGMVVGFMAREYRLLRRLSDACRETISYISYLNRHGQSPFYAERWLKYTPRAVQQLARFEWGRCGLRCRVTATALKAIDQNLPLDGDVVSLLQRHQPDVVVASPGNMRFGTEIDYVRAAKRLGIPSALAVHSLDNLTTKGVFHAYADCLLVWNKRQSEEATSLHGYPRDRILVTGAPGFDKWFDHKGKIVGRTAFAERVGLDPDSPYVLYLGSSRNIAKDECWVVREFKRHLLQREETKRLQILVRPHPANVAIYCSLDRAVARVYPPAGSLPDTAEARDMFASSLHHSVAAVGINTSGMLDAIMALKACYAIVLGEYDKTQSATEHFQLLKESGALGLCHGIPALVSEVAASMNGGDDRLAVARRDFARSFARPCCRDVEAGAINAWAIEGLASGRSVLYLAEHLHEAARDRRLGRP